MVKWPRRGCTSGTETDCCVRKRRVAELRQTEDVLETAPLWQQAMQRADQVVSNQSKVVQLFITKVNGFCTDTGPEAFNLLLRIPEETLLLTGWGS